jgi:signal peptidase I
MNPVKSFWRDRKWHRLGDGIILVLALLCLIRELVALPVEITGVSMLPNCRHGELGLVNKLAYCFHRPRRGDLVAVRNEGELIIKRVLGLPGEEIAIQQGTIYVDGQRLAEPYLRHPNRDDIGAGVLEARSYMVIGDNRPSTAVAVVNEKRILGRVIPLRWRIVANSGTNDDLSP